MRRKEVPFIGRRYVIDKNPLSRLVHDLDRETQSCNIDKILMAHIRMVDTESQVNLHILLNPEYTLCGRCIKKE